VCFSLFTFTVFNYCFSYEYEHEYSGERFHTYVRPYVCPCVTTYNFAGPCILNVQALYYWPPLQGKCAHADTDLICILIRSGTLRSTFTVYAITRKILQRSAAIFLLALSGLLVMASMSLHLHSVTLLKH